MIIKQYRQQFGILTRALDSSQLGLSIVKNMNQMVQKHRGLNPIVFYSEYYQPVATPLFAMMQDVEMWSYPYTVISTDIASTFKLNQAPIPKRKIFYVHDLEWLYLHQRNYDQLVHVYNNDEIELVARSQSHAQLLTECWKEPIAIVKDFNYEDLMKIL